MCETISMTADEYYQAYPSAERVGQVGQAFNQLIAANTIQIMTAPEDPAVGLVTTTYRFIPEMALQNTIDMG